MLMRGPEPVGVFSCAEPRLRERVRSRDLMLPGLVGSAVDENIDLGRGKAAALDAMGHQLSVEAEGTGDASSFSSGTPASTAAPRNMSPLIPEKQSRKAMRITNPRGECPKFQYRSREGLGKRGHDGKRRRKQAG